MLNIRYRVHRFFIYISYHKNISFVSNFLFEIAGLGVGMARDPAALMVGQYFKRKRELVEIVLVSGSGLGITIMSIFVKESIGYLFDLSIYYKKFLYIVTFSIQCTYTLINFSVQLDGAWECNRLQESFCSLFCWEHFIDLHHYTILKEELFYI